MKYFTWAVALLAVLSAGCDKLPDTPEMVPEEENAFVSVYDVARLLASVSVEEEQMREVHDAASASALNGYDEEYRMQDLFADPGSGVGDDGPTKAGRYDRPLRDLLREAVLNTKAGEALGTGTDDPEAWLDSLSCSDVQIYWPFSEDWDGVTRPVITFDPGGEAERSEGYLLGSDGSLQKLLVTEEMARERPVWVVNRNSDADYKSLELRRREDPSWGTGGGDILVKSGDESKVKTLVLRSFKAKRQYDSWLAGGAEFFVKIGAIEDFTASTEAELRLYEPSITDFMIVVRRKQMGEELPFNAVLVSEWTPYQSKTIPYLESCAFMIIEDDGGTRTSWKCSAMVKYNSKSYGFELEIPLYTRDDIVWRGALTRGYIEDKSGKICSYGDVDIVMELI